MIRRAAQTRTSSSNSKIQNIKLKQLFSIFGLAIFAGSALAPAYAETVQQPPTTALESRAAYYIDFRNDIDRVDAMAPRSAADTREIHNILASHDPDMLSSGWIAYAALIAADNPTFAAAIKEAMQPKKIRQSEKNRWSRRKNPGAVSDAPPKFLTDLKNNPQSVRNLPGADAAIRDVISMAARDAMRVSQIGDKYIAEAYATQNQGWAKKKISDGTSRVQSALDYSYSKSHSPAPVLPASVDQGVRSPGLNNSERSWTPTWSSASANGVASANAGPILDRVLVLAARYAVGELNDPIVNGYAKNSNARRCIHMAKLNFDQCIAATRTPNEEIFCIGKHGLTEVSGCIGSIAGVGGL